MSIRSFAAFTQRIRPAPKAAWVLCGWALGTSLILSEAALPKAALTDSAAGHAAQSKTMLQLELELFAYDFDWDGDGRVARWELEGTDYESWIPPDRRRPLLQREWRRLVAQDFNDQVLEVFTIFDADASGDWSASEIPRAHANPLRQLDLDRNGRIDRREIRGLPQLPAFDSFSLQDPESAWTLREAWLDGLLEDGPLVIADLSGTTLEELRDYDFDRDGTLTRGEIDRGELWLEQPASFRVEGEVARVVGLLTSELDDKLGDLLEQHPEVRVLELAFVPGTIDEDMVLQAGRRLQAANIATRVPPGGMVASGGVTLLACGRGRQVGEDARVGVHSWSYRLAGMMIDGRDHPRTSFEHARTLELYRELEIPEPLYWFALRASDSAGLHWMTREELDRYGFGRYGGPSGARR